MVKPEHRGEDFDCALCSIRVFLADIEFVESCITCIYDAFDAFRMLVCENSAELYDYYNRGKSRTC